MAMNQQCPRCGSNRVQLSNIESKRGCLWFVLFGIFYLIWLPIKWMIGLTIFFVWDWWMSMIYKSQGKGYVWKSKRWFSGRKKAYYCHDCAYNFKG